MPHLATRSLCGFNPSSSSPHRVFTRRGADMEGRRAPTCCSAAADQLGGGGLSGVREARAARQDDSWWGVKEGSFGSEAAKNLGEGRERGGVVALRSHGA